MSREAIAVTFLKERMMIERVHEHIIQELRQNSRTESLFVLTAIALNLLTMGVNAGLASNASTTTVGILVVTLALVVVVNFVATMGLRKGEETKTRLLEGLARMYQDQNVASYYDLSLLGTYRSRYNLLLVAVIATGIASLLIPAIILVTR